MYFVFLLFIFDIIIINQNQLGLPYGNDEITKEAVTNFFEGLATNITSTVAIGVTLDSTPHQKTTKVKRDGEFIVLPVYSGSDQISGTIDVEIKNTNRYEHLGLKCYLIGLLQIYSDSSLSTQFITLSKQLQAAGYLAMNKTYRFKFSNFDKDYESYSGKAGRVRYVIRAVLNRNMVGPLTEDAEFAVFKSDIQSNEPITPTVLQVGVEDRLHIQFRLTKNRYHIKQWVEGSVMFHLVRLNIQKMALQIIRRQTLGTPDSTTSKSKVLQVFEVMDGCPLQGTIIPFRMSMRGVKNLAPSYKSIHNRLFVRHWLNLVIYDEEGRRYFKQAQVTFYRK